MFLRRVGYLSGLVAVNAAALAFLMGVGCGSERPGIPVEDVPEVFAMRFCRALAGCHSTPSVASCLEAFDNNHYLQVVRLIKEGQIGYNRKAADYCLRVRARFACQARTAVGVARQMTACTAGFIGSLVAGETCLVDEECTSGLCQTQGCTDACCTGMCAHVAASGGDCRLAPCGPSEWCNPQNTICEALAWLGQDCSTTPCAQGLLCEPEKEICVEPAGSGQRCILAIGDRSCARFDEYCKSSSEQCRRRRAVGAPCQDSDNPCVAYAACRAGRCWELPREGADCVSEVGCLGDLRCQEGICTAPAQVSCASDAP